MALSNNFANRAYRITRPGISMKVARPVVPYHRICETGTPAEIGVTRGHGIQIAIAACTRLKSISNAPLACRRGESNPIPINTSHSRRIVAKHLRNLGRLLPGH